MEQKHTWGWPVAIDLFLGGVGGGMTVVATAADLFFRQSSPFILGCWVAAALIGLACSLLILELGRPLQFYRIFSTQRAILTVGGWMLGALILSDIVYGSFGLSFLPWYSLQAPRTGLAWINLLLGAGVTIYTGVFLGSIKSRPFWNSPALPVLFFISALSTGIAAQSLVVRGWWLFNPQVGEAVGVENLLRTLVSGFLVLEALVLLVYVLMMQSTGSETAARAAATWLRGGNALGFWGGVLGIGIVGPLILYALGQEWMLVLAALGVLSGGLILRFLVVYTDERKMLPGEEQFFAGLPGGDEAFLHAWE